MIRNETSSSSRCRQRRCRREGSRHRWRSFPERNRRAGGRWRGGGTKETIRDVLVSYLIPWLDARAVEPQVQEAKGPFRLNERGIHNNRDDPLRPLLPPRRGETIGSQTRSVSADHPCKHSISIFSHSSQHAESRERSSTRFWPSEDKTTRRSGITKTLPY